MLTETAYGKSGIRLVQVRRDGERHTIADLTIAVRFEGDYDRSYVAGDNAAVLPTDTMKNTVYALAARGPVGEPEAFGLALARHFLARNPPLARIRVDLVEHPWVRIAQDGRPHGHAFLRRGPDTRTARVVLDRERSQVDAGIADLVVLKSAHSAFSGFLRDEYTTLADTRDRLLATSLTATWTYDPLPDDCGAAWHHVRQALLDGFAEHDSESVQHTLHAMGRAAVAAVPEVARVHLVMPNRHHLPVDLTPIGIDTRHEVFVATDAPSGLIEGTVTRE
jgi:urate oxidase